MDADRRGDRNQDRLAAARKSRASRKTLKLSPAVTVVTGVNCCDARVRLWHTADLPHVMLCFCPFTRIENVHRLAWVVGLQKRGGGITREKADLPYQLAA